ncbi:hypothetical protein [Halobacteriovorax sp. RT-2-6]|uniref:hypothetical protein n=2 Tax=Halobacteriovorax TaxID=1652133 RepID=UPI000CD0FEE8|nr:hypothetical protein C0Z22_03965 [Halobacteriovorax sp. DA5]
MSLKFEKNSTKTAKSPTSKTNYFIICTLSLMTHGVLIYNWLITRSLYNLIFMVAAIAFAIFAMIPMIKEYYAKVRLFNDSELLRLEVDRLKNDIKDLKDSKKSLQIKLSQEMDIVSGQKEQISEYELMTIELQNTMEDIKDQLLVVNDGHKGMESIVDAVNELREKGLEFIKELPKQKDAQLQAEQGDVKFKETFEKFMSEFQDMKDIIFQLKTLSFRVDVQASLLNDSEMTQSSSELEGLSRNLAKFFNNVIGLLSNLEETYRGNQDELIEKLSKCRDEMDSFLDSKQDIACEIEEVRGQIEAASEIIATKMDLVEETIGSEENSLSDFLDDEDVDADSEIVKENTMISATNAQNLDSQIIQ